jgi:Rrf2 family cysteine metabolism transcriptional repressor
VKLSTRTRYGILAILELAENYGKGPLQLKAIARRQELSVKYLEQLMAVLKSAGIVRSIRGARGGYVLAKAPGKVKISECFNCLEGPVITAECIENSRFCARSLDCVARGLWAQLQQVISGVLDSMTLQDLLERAKDNKTVDYQI